MASTNALATFFFSQCMKTACQNQRTKVHEENCNPNAINSKWNQAIIKMVLSLLLLNALKKEWKGKNKYQGITYIYLFLPKTHPGIVPVSLFPVK